MTDKQIRKKTIRRLQSMYPLRAKINESYQNSLTAMKDQKPTVWSMANWWQADPIFKAMDLEVIYPENYGAVLAASGQAAQYLDIADADGFPTHLCGYARVNFGFVSKRLTGDATSMSEAPMGGLPHPVLLLSSGHICDARVKWFEALGHYLNTPVWMMETPTPGVEELFVNGAFEQAVAFVMDELREFIAFMEKLLQKKMDWDRYDEVVSDMLDLCQMAHETFELRKLHPCPMHSRDFWSVMPSYLFLLGDLKASIRLFHNLKQELLSLVKEMKGAVEPETYRLAFAEIPPWHSLEFFDQLAERGWNFVVETWGYHPPLPVEGIREIHDPIRRHALFHLQFISARYKTAALEQEYFGYLGYPYLDYVRDYQCDGIFLHPIVTCRSTSVHLPYVQSLLLEKAKVPSLVVEGDIVDLRLFDPIEALRRAEAFEETMQYYRNIRKADGMKW
jgi:benzoyl-CoA reductase subunit B